MSELLVSEEDAGAPLSQLAEVGLRSCLILPLRTDREPGGALAIYGKEPGCFTGAGHDVALLFAAQGGVAMRNAAEVKDIAVDLVEGRIQRRQFAGGN